MANEEEIDGSDFVGLDDEEISLEALEQRLQTLQEKKEQIQKRKQKEEILAKIKQAEAELSSMQSSSAYAKNEIDQWDQQKLEEFFKTKGIRVKKKSLNELKSLAKSISESKISDYEVSIPSEAERRTVQIGESDQTFKSVNDIQTWSKDLTVFSIVQHFQVYAYILTSFEFSDDVNRLMNLQNEDGFVLYKDKCIDSIKQHCLGNNYYYVACSCSTSCSNWKNIETVWLLLHEIEGLKSAGCSCSRDNGCCRHVIAFLLTLASFEKTNVSRKTRKETRDQGTQIYSARGSAAYKESNGQVSSDENTVKVSTIYTEKSDDKEDTHIDVWTPPSFLSKTKENKIQLPTDGTDPGSFQSKVLKENISHLKPIEQVHDVTAADDPFKQLRQPFTEKLDTDTTKGQGASNDFPKRQTKQIIVPFPSLENHEMRDKIKKSESGMNVTQTPYSTEIGVPILPETKPLKPNPAPFSSNYLQDIMRTIESNNASANIIGNSVGPLMYPTTQVFTPVQPLVYPGQTFAKPLIPAKPASISQPAYMPILPYPGTTNTVPPRVMQTSVPIAKSNVQGHIHANYNPSPSIANATELTKPTVPVSNQSDAYGFLKILNDEFEEINTQKEIAIRPLETSGTGITQQRKVYSRRFLLFLQKSKFAQTTPGNLLDIPDIIISSNDHKLATGYFKSAPSKKKTTPRKTVEDEKPESVPNEIMSTEDVMRRVISAINMLKHGGDTKMVVNVISELPINNEDSLTRVVSLVVDTVAEDPSLTSTCCNICRVLARIKLPKGDDSNQLVTFSSVYGEKFEREIEYGIMSRPTESYRKRVEEIARFTGSIARHTLLKNADIHDILMKLSQSNLESFCILLTDVWDRMEKCKSGDYIDLYYGVIDAELSSNDQPTSLKYKLLQLKNKRR